jgi:hypothetical protein
MDTKAFRDQDVVEVLEACRKLALAGPLDHGWLDGFFAEDERNIYYRLCYWLARALRPRAMVELGVCEGRCTAHLAGGYLEAEVHAVDIGKHGAYKRHTSWLDNIVYHQAKSIDPAVLAEVYDGSVGICLVDSVHAWDYVMQEVTAWIPKMAPSGVFLFDDLDWDDGMKGLMDKLPFEQKGRMDDMHPGYGFGWAVVP